MVEKNGFYQFSLPLEENLFHSLSTSVSFEDVGKGRKGNHLVKLSDKGIPLVRTTTKYTIPAHDFSDIHNAIVDQIETTAKNIQEEFVVATFNNALIEIYNNEYTKMKYHSDQCLDIAPDSFIALFSCYEKPDEVNKQVLRKLKVRDKVTLKEFEFTLENNSVVFFSIATNSKFQHKIVLEPVHHKEAVSDNRWLGITFRTSKTFIHFKDDKPYFSDGLPLELGNEEQRKAFYMTRGKENKSMDFEYPSITYTLSPSDILFPR